MKITKKQKAYFKARVLWHMPYELLSLLIKENALEGYLSNTCERYFSVFVFDWSYHQWYIDLHYKSRAYDIICDFIWEDTKEGDIYWRKIFNKLNETNYGKKEIQ